MQGYLNKLFGFSMSIAAILSFSLVSCFTPAAPLADVPEAAALPSAQPVTNQRASRTGDLFHVAEPDYVCIVYLEMMLDWSSNAGNRNITPIKIVKGRFDANAFDILYGFRIENLQIDEKQAINNIRRYIDLREVYKKIFPKDQWLI